MGQDSGALTWTAHISSRHRYPFTSDHPLTTRFWCPVARMDQIGIAARLLADTDVILRHAGGPVLASRQLPAGGDLRSFQMIPASGDNLAGKLLQLELRGRGVCAGTSVNYAVLQQVGDAPTCGAIALNIEGAGNYERPVADIAPRAPAYLEEMKTRPLVQEGALVDWTDWPAETEPSLRVIYIVPSSFNAGGTRMVLRHCHELIGRGHRCGILVETMREGGFRWYGDVDPRLRIAPLGPFNQLKLGDPDIVVATLWRTWHRMIEMDCLGMFGSRRRLLYFIQALEDRFLDDIDLRRLARRTYTERHDIQAFTEARWIQTALAEWYGRDAALIMNGNDMPDPASLPPMDVPDGPPIILVEGQLTYTNKGAYHALRVLTPLAESGRARLWALSSEAPPWELPMCSGMFFGVSWRDALSVIAHCDIFVKFSQMEGDPLSVREAMCLGKPIVMADCTGAREHCFHEVNALLIPVADGRRLYSAVERLLDDPRLADRLGHTAAAYAWNHLPKWSSSIDALEALFLAGQGSCDAQSVDNPPVGQI